MVREAIMSEIQTVRGSITPAQLGQTLVHEHVLFQFLPERRAESLAVAVAMLQKARRVGLQTIVCLTPFRDIAWYREINQQVDINIIASTGYYLEQLTSVPLRDLCEDEMVARFVRELTVGIDGSNIRAGIIKVAANWPTLTAWEQRVLRAAARAQRETGAPIATHACAGARNQMEYLLEHGADLNHTFYSHVECEWGWEGRNLAEEAAHLADIARQGGALLFNNFGFEWDTPWPDLLYLLRHLIAMGYRDRVMISVDANWTWNDLGQVEFEAARAHPSAAERDYAYMMTHALPALKTAGFADDDLRAFLVDNPRRLFSP
jgi:phosphotriesterase-related protein